MGAMSTYDWTPDALPDLGGRTAIVTGGNSGIGFHTALELARHGAAVTLACRNTGSAEDAADRIRAEAPGAEVGVGRLDLSSLASVREFADGWQGPVDILVNNAGVMTPPRYRETEDGFELQFGTNHLGHYALTGHLLPALLEAPAARVVAVSSIAHHAGADDLLEGNPRSTYSPQRTYGNSKLANILFADELQRQAAARGSSLTAAAAHPGVAHTNLVTSPDGLGAIPGVRFVAPLFLKLVLQSAAKGAWGPLYAATAAEPGSYTGPQRLREQRGPVGPAKRQRRARDPQLAQKLWTLSEEKTGVSYPWPA
jgi:NAD(P)-dependent dehydrogenase (short-subunit alcohol dehydrogenase family)